MTTPILNTFAFLLTNPDGSDMSLMELFHAGKEIMWPILLLSFLGTTVVIERILFIIRENGTREPEVVEKMLAAMPNSSASWFETGHYVPREAPEEFTAALLGFLKES